MSSLPLVGRGAGRNRLHLPRSRNGCLTCKRRKVRCNEQRPKCYHCNRLNLNCVWEHAGERRMSLNRRDALPERPTEPSIAASAAQTDWPSTSANIMDFVQGAATDSREDFEMFQDLCVQDFSDYIATGDTLQGRTPSTGLDGTTRLPVAPAQSSPKSLLEDSDAEESILSHTTTILDPIENGPICASMRALLAHMASVSPMVRYSMGAFAAIQHCLAEGKTEYRKYYDQAADELSESFRKPVDNRTASASELGCVLTTIFFLTYINFLTGRMDLAISNLAYAHTALQTSSNSAISSLEQRIISWIRWSDVRAALAGGQGQIINETSGIYTSTTSTASPGSDVTSSAGASESDPNEVVYGVLCQPGIAFFQEVQTITGRITRIAHDQRSRGSVEDETEVMAIAAEILKDLSSLYERRPALMDLAVSGNINVVLTEPLASSIANSFQTYLANFYVCYIHLHRVAHRHLVRSDAVCNAMRRIKEIMHLMVSSNESFTVNVLWPLFLWGTEEDDRDERQWILQTIRSLRHVATNANIAADVLQEIQRRQDEAGTRVDIRSTCVELFNTMFVII